MSVIHTIFPLQNSWMLLLSLFLGSCSSYLAIRDKEKWGLMTLFFTAFFIRLFMAHLDPFLHEWDERYHALVARNLMHNPLKPMLVNNPILPYHYEIWTYNHVWLHKQPMFLWQMALSMTLFGVSEFTIRYPSVLMGALGVLLIYRICFLFTRNRASSFLAAMLTCFSYYHLEMVSGYIGMDHNDVAFNFYVLASIWAYMEYLNNKSYKWAVLIGVFAGFAILNKWLIGLLVFSGWGINILLLIKSKNVKTYISHFATSLTICAIIFIPWQIYIFHQFPLEAKYEFKFNSRHIFEAIEGHTGDSWYYWHKFSIFFGDYLYFLVPVGLLYSFVDKKYRNEQNLALSCYFLLIFCFFSFVVQTKIYTYFMVAVPIGYIYISIVLSSIFLTEKSKWFFYFPVTLGCAFLLFSLSKITKTHDPEGQDGYWQKHAYNTRIIKDIERIIPPKSVVVLNGGMAENIDVMFFNNTLTAYSGIDDSIIYMHYLRERNMQVYLLRSESSGQFPPYIEKDNKNIIVNETLK